MSATLDYLRGRERVLGRHDQDRRLDALQRRLDLLEAIVDDGQHPAGDHLLRDLDETGGAW